VLLFLQCIKVEVQLSARKRGKERRDFPPNKVGTHQVSRKINQLQVNAEINHVKNSIHTLCMDGRECIRWVSSGKKELAATSSAKNTEQSSEKNDADAAEWAPPECGLVWHHAVMNLPRTAVEFCDAFQGAFPKATWEGKMPLVHCYTFQKSETEAGVLDAFMHVSEA
jgi:tRNA G37 N-methylase Trm5